MAEEETQKGKAVIISLAIIAILLIFLIALKIMLVALNPGPPSSTFEEREAWLELLENTSWEIDSSTKKIGLTETGLSPISALRIGIMRDSGFILVMVESGDFTYAGRLSNGDEALELEIAGNILLLWYTEGTDGSYPTVTVQGEKEKLFFNAAD